MKNQRLYKAEMTGFPPEALIWRHENEVPEWEAGFEVAEETRKDGIWYGFEDPTWEPEGWDEYVVANDLVDRRETERQGHTVYMTFRWPSTERNYKSRSSAKDRVNLIEMWGGTAELMETTTDWTPVEVANRQRKIQRLEARRAKKLMDAAELIEQIEALNEGDAS